MTEKARESGAVTAGESPDLTLSIRNLAMPLASVDDPGNDNDGHHTALLVTRDSASQKWGPRWLRQTGLKAVLISDPAVALDTARSIRPGVILVDAGLSSGAGTSLIAAFQDAADLDVPVIALCNNAKEVRAAIDVDTFDVVRKPVEWQVASRRAMQAVKTQLSKASLRQTQRSFEEALKLADSARLHLRSRESFEPVTGLPNKSRFVDLLRRAMAAAERDKNILAVFVIGFNRFRLVVEAMGQEAANKVLAEVGNRLSNSLKDAGSAQANSSGLRTAAAASIDAMRFGLMLTCSTQRDELALLQQELTKKLSRPVQIPGQTVYLSACVGIALYPLDAGDVDSLLQRADNAMRDAQSRGGGFRYYSDEIDAAAARKLKIEHMLHEALDRGDLTLVYQPITNVADGIIVGADARPPDDLDLVDLMQWHVGDGPVHPPEQRRVDGTAVDEDQQLVGELAIEAPGSDRPLSVGHAPHVQAGHHTERLGDAGHAGPADVRRGEDEHRGRCVLADL